MHYFLLTFVLFFSFPAFAQDHSSLLALPEGATLMSVSALERVEVEQDLLTATLRAHAEHENAAIAQNTVNTLMTKALEDASKVKNVKAATLHYNIYQHDPNRNKALQTAKPVWRAEQSLQIKGTDDDAILKLAGALQEDGFLLDGLSYSISPALQDSTQSDLLESALAKLTAKAERAGKALRKGNVSLLKVDVGQDFSPSPAPRMMRSMAADSFSEMSAPVAAPGQDEITLNVSAVALLKP